MAGLDRGSGEAKQLGATAWLRAASGGRSAISWPLNYPRPAASEQQRDPCVGRGPPCPVESSREGSVARAVVWLSRRPVHDPLQGLPHRCPGLPESACFMWGVSPTSGRPHPRNVQAGREDRAGSHQGVWGSPLYLHLRWPVALHLASLHASAPGPPRLQSWLHLRRKGAKRWPGLLETVRMWTG